MAVCPAVVNAKWYTYMFIIAYQERYVRLVAQLSMGRAPSFRRQQLSNNIVRTGEPRPHWGWAAPCKVSHRPPRRDTVLGPARGAARQVTMADATQRTAGRLSTVPSCQTHCPPPGHITRTRAPPMPLARQRRHIGRIRAERGRGAAEACSVASGRSHW